MSETFKVQVLTPVGIVFSGRATEVVLPGKDGQIGVLAAHQDIVGLLGTGALKLVIDAKPRWFMVSSGFYEVTNGELSILCEIAETPENLDRALASEKAAELRRALEGLSAFAPEFPQLSAELGVEEAKLVVLGKA